MPEETKEEIPATKHNNFAEPNDGKVKMISEKKDKEPVIDEALFEAGGDDDLEVVDFD